MPSSSRLSEDVDIYCLGCGYNLRGLSGDPRRCPECGHMNPMGTAEIPARLITEQLRRMETAPALCAGLSMLAMVMLLPAVMIAMNGLGGPSGEDIICVGVSLLGCLFGILVAMSRFKRSCRDHAQWLAAMGEYWLHAVGLGLLVFGPPALVSLLVYLNMTDAIASIPEAVAWTLHVVAWVVVLVVIITLGSPTHRKLKRILHPLQRDVAVQIARDTLRKKLYQGGRGSFG